MKNLIKFCLVVTMILLPLACDQDSSDIASSGVENFNKSVNNKVTQDDVIDIPLSDFGTGDIVLREGSSATLHRNKNGITANFNATGLTPGDAYTMWFIIFAANGDFIDALYATGHVIGASGTGNFSAHLSEGDATGSIATDTGLTNAETNEVHLVIRTHGQALPGMVDDQIHSLMGGCGEGDPARICDDVLAAIFVAP